MPINLIPGHPGYGKEFPTGAVPTPHSEILAATPFNVRKALKAAPAQVAYVPDYWSAYLNDTYGICVTSEECFAKSVEHLITGVSKIIIPDAEAKRWAQSHGVLNGADLGQVLDWMYVKGFVLGQQTYNDGKKLLVDFSNPSVLQTAIANNGPVKIAIRASALPSGAGNRNGWYSLSSNTRGTDHCVAVSGYGPAGWLYQQLKEPLPSGLSGETPGYLLYTWGTMGFVTDAWLKGTCDEAWARNPNTIGVPPLIPVNPPPPPPPPPGPGPNPTAYEIVLSQAMPAGKYLAFPNTPV